MLKSYLDPAHHRWVRWLARSGYAARAFVYFLVGGLAVLAAFTAKEAIGKKEALKDLMDNSWGPWVIGLLIVGLVGYILWRLIQSIGDTDDHGHDAKGLGVRAGLLISAATYAALGYYLFTLLFTGQDDGRGGWINNSRGTLEDWLNTDWVAYLLGAGFLVTAGAHFWKAWKKKYKRHFTHADLDDFTWIDPVSRLGLFARGVVLAIIGGMFIYRGWTVEDDNDTAPGLADALRFVGDLPAGTWLLAALGFGLLLFASYSAIEVWFRRINVEEASAPGSD